MIGGLRANHLELNQRRWLMICFVVLSAVELRHDEEVCEVLIALVGVPVIGLCYSALGETRSVKERPRTRPSRLCAGGSAAAALWIDRPTAV